MASLISSSRACLRRPSKLLRHYATAPNPSAKDKRFLLKLGFLTVGTAALTVGLAYKASGGASLSRAAPVSSTLPLSVTHFTPTVITASDDAGGPTKLIKLKLPPSLIPKPDETGDPLTPVYSVYLKDSDIQVERPYTPLHGISEDGEMLFWVKRYQRGEVGRWFNRREVGEVVEIRGPVRTFEWANGDYDEVILISGGTGITPFYQLLHGIFGGGTAGPGSTHFTLLHASPSASTLPPPLILDDLHSYAQNNSDRFSMKLFFSEKPETLMDSVFGRIDKGAIEVARRERGLVKIPSRWDWLWGNRTDAQERKKKVLFIVCGPESMITDITGARFARPRKDGLSGGILGELGYTVEEVKKL